MYLRKIEIKNLGPIKKLEIIPRFEAISHPVPIAIVGKNGAGKSLMLSVILDAVTEARRRVFRKIPEISDNQFLKLSSKNYIKHDGMYSHTIAEFSIEKSFIKYAEIVSNLTFEEFKEKASELLNPPGGLDDEFHISGFHKNVAISDGNPPIFNHS